MHPNDIGSWGPWMLWEQEKEGGKADRGSGKGYVQRKGEQARTRCRWEGAKRKCSELQTVKQILCLLGSLLLGPAPPTPLPSHPDGSSQKGSLARAYRGGLGGGRRRKGRRGAQGRTRTSARNYEVIWWTPNLETSVPSSAKWGDDFSLIGCLWEVKG